MLHHKGCSVLQEKLLGLNRDRLNEFGIQVYVLLNTNSVIFYFSTFILLFTYKIKINCLRF